MSEPSSATIMILDYIKIRNLDVICDDTDLDTHQFPITKTKEALQVIAERQQVGRIIIHPQEF